MSVKIEENKQAYEVIIYRVDNNHILFMQTLKFDEAVDKWKELNTNWEESLSAKKPFKLMQPLVTSFDPGLIKEIRVQPLIKVDESKYDNPYQQKMMKEGLSGMFQNKGNAINPNMLDEGYS